MREEGAGLGWRARGGGRVLRASLTPAHTPALRTHPPTRLPPSRRHPASGYVQGMNDLVTPFLAVFLSEHLPGPLEGWRPERLSEAAMLQVEADCYWCLCRLLEGIQDHYTYAQPGIQRTVFKLKELISRIDAPLAAHLAAQSVDFIQFAFRWVNCLLIRELPFHLAIRLWDTYLSEAAAFADFLVYVCAALLLQHREAILAGEFQDIIMLLQRLPTGEWDEDRMEVLLSSAFMSRASTAGAPGGEGGGGGGTGGGGM